MKKFSDTSRFSEEWYQTLPPEMKCAFEYIWAHCDHAGVWTANRGLADYIIGKKVDWDGLAARLSGRVIVHEGRWILVGYVEMQFGKLSADSRVHRVVIDALRKHSMLNEDSLSIDYPAACQQAINSLQGQYKDKDKDQDTEGVQGEILQAWNALPEPFPRCRLFSEDRKKALRSRLRDSFWRENWKLAIDRIPSDPFLRGEGKDGWVADIDWFLRPDSVAKIVEGKYAHVNGHKPHIQPRLDGDF